MMVALRHIYDQSHAPPRISWITPGTPHLVALCVSELGGGVGECSLGAPFDLQAVQSVTAGYRIRGSSIKRVTHRVAGALVYEDGTGAVLVEVFVDALLGACMHVAYFSSAFINGLWQHRCRPQ